MEIVLQLTSDMNMRAFRTQAGNEGDNNFVRFKINRPSNLDGYVCRADFSIADASNYILVDNDAFLLPNSLTKPGELSIQLIYTQSDGDVVAKTNIVTLSIGNSINAVNQADMEFQDGLSQLANDSFAQVKYEDDNLSFYNRNGVLRDSVTIAGGTGGTNDHSQLVNRDAENSHPAGAIAFEDGMSFQDKYDAGELTGKQGEQGLIGKDGPQGIQGEGFDQSDILRIDGLEIIATNHGNRITINETNITTMQSENTAIWVLLNDVDNRSRANATSIASLQENIGSGRTLLKEMVLEESVYSLSVDLDFPIEDGIQIIVIGSGAGNSVVYYTSFNDDRIFTITGTHFYTSSGNIKANTGLRSTMSVDTFTSFLNLKRSFNAFIGESSFMYSAATVSGHACYFKEDLESINSIQITSANMLYLIPMGTRVQIYNNP